jgi:hypothetical protein
MLELLQSFKSTHVKAIMDLINAALKTEEKEDQREPLDVY